MIGVTPHGGSGLRHELVYGRSISSVANEQSQHQKQRQGLLAHRYPNRSSQLFLSKIVQLSTFTRLCYLILGASLPGAVRAWRTRFAGEKGVVIPSYRGSHPRTTSDHPAGEPVGERWLYECLLRRIRDAAPSEGAFSKAPRQVSRVLPKHLRAANRLLARRPSRHPAPRRWCSRAPRGSRRPPCSCARSCSRA